MPAGVRVSVVDDRTDTIKASIHEVEITLALSVGLVILVVLLFLRTLRATLIAGVALPLSLIATFAVMWGFGYSLDNLSLMALVVGAGFVVDDAIVMIENVQRHIENGEPPLKAAYEGAREIGFTIVSLTASLVAVFIPLLFMGGLIGRVFREFAATLTIAVVVSMVISLTLTPMMCGRLLKAPEEGKPSAMGRAAAAASERVHRGLPSLAAVRAAPPDGDPADHARDADRDRLALRDRAQGFPAAAGFRPDHRDAGGRAGRILLRTPPPRRSGDKGGARRPGGAKRRLGARRRRADADLERRPHDDRAEAA